MRRRSFMRTMRRPSRSPWPTRIAWAVIGIATILFVTAVVRNLQRQDSMTQWRQSLETAAGRPAWPEWASSWPPLATPVRRRRHQIPQDLHGAYAYAARSHEVLRHIPCYCGCVREGHHSNLNCFVTGFRPDGTPIWTDHSFNCPMCVHIAREAMLMSSQGMSLQRTREEIDQRYRAVGEPTTTPLHTDLETRR